MTGSFLHRTLVYTPTIDIFRARLSHFIRRGSFKKVEAPPAYPKHVYSKPAGGGFLRQVRLCESGKLAGERIVFLFSGVYILFLFV